MNQKQIIESAAFSAGATVGAMGSRVVADKLTTTLKSGAVRHGLLGIVGIALVAFITPKDNATKFAQGAGVGIAATQLTDALKSVMTEDGKKTMEEETEILLYKLVNLLISKYRLSRWGNKMRGL